MTTTEYLQREIRRAELSVRRAERKPNTPAEELRGLNEKLEHLQEALEAVNEHWQRVHEQRGWTAHIDREKWEPCEFCGYAEHPDKKLFQKDGYLFYAGYTKQYAVDSFHEEETEDVKLCPRCSRPLTDEAWAELERRVMG